jgi:hypothetical protein
MAITRSQIARQLLAEGGVSLDDAKMMAPEGEFLAYINPKEAQMLKDAGGSGIMTPMGIPSFVDFGGSGTGYGSAADTFSAAGGNPGENSRSDFGGGDGGGGSPPTQGPKGPPTVGGGGDYEQYITPNPYGRQVTNLQRNVARGVASVVGGPVAGLTVNELLSREQEKQRDLQKAISGGQQFFGTTPRSLTTQFRETTGMKTGPSGPPGGTGGDSPIIPKLPQVASLPTDIETPKSDLQKSFDVRFFLDPRFEAKDGGEVTVDQAEKMAPPGESLAYINDDEAALLKAIGGAGEPVNQTGIPSYFIKKIFRKAKKAVKKIAKSPLGKAALVYGATAGLGALGAGAARAGSGFGLFSPSNVLANLGTAGGNVASFFSGRTNLNDYDPKRGLFRKGLDFLKENPAAVGIGAASLAGGLMTPKQEEEELSTKISKETGLPIAQIRKEVQEATAQGQDALDALSVKYPFLVRADSALKDGGKAKKKTYRYKDKPYGPKFAAEGGIMNLDGMEMDLRGGGFVPIGKAEKADDVPARLSKNEFVFTADAVRAAGGGSVDKGADLMYKTMKQLEDRVA